MLWTPEKLAQQPRHRGFRLRGLEMTRLETFADAAFAFALTLLVISVDEIPGSLEELVDALKGVPAFAACFASLAALWIDHRRWSRRYGLEDMPSTLITLVLVFIMLVYVYPLKMMFSAFFAWASGGWLPTTFAIENVGELTLLFIIYGVGFAAVMLMMGLLYWRALAMRDELALDAYEVAQTEARVGMSALVGVTAVLSALFAWLMPSHLGVMAGFVYMSLAVTVPSVAIYYGKRADIARDG